ncbi:hypothetical protein BH09VER1_BH09VER1_16950 [soil metagenome]
MKTTLHFILLSTLCLASAAHAAVIFQENFDTLTSGTTVVGQNGWANNSGTGSSPVSNTLPAYSSPNYLSLYAGGTVQHSFTAASLTASDTSFNYYFMAGTSVVAGHNLQLSLRDASGYVFYMNIQGGLASLDIGLINTTTTNKAFSSSLSKNVWYVFAATIDQTTDVMSYSVAAASGGSSLLSSSITLSSTSINRFVVGSSASTASGDWSFDSLSINSVPEPGTTALAIGGGLFALIFLRKRSRA